MTHTFGIANITEHGVYTLIDGINTSKSSGPDGIPGKLFQSLANELAPVLCFIFEQSLCLAGAVANVADLRLL